MSIVQFQNTLILDSTTYSRSNGADVTEEMFINGSISTYADDGEKVFDAEFLTKKTYDLFNYTLDQTETTYTTYNTTTRTAKIAGFARNPVFRIHTSLMKYIPLVVAHISPELYQQARDRLLDMEYAECFYITAYPTYDGYRIEHDPTYIAYCSLTSLDESSSQEETDGGSGNGGLVLVSIAGAVAVAVVLVARRHH
jgi:hypothetical protein